MAKMGREPLEDKKERLIIFVHSSKIKEHGGKKSLQKRLAAIAENGIFISGKSFKNVEQP